MRQVLTATEEIISHEIAKRDQERRQTWRGEQPIKQPVARKKHRSVDLLRPEKAVHAIAKIESTRKLSGHSCTEPVAQGFQAALYHMKQDNSNSSTYRLEITKKCTSSPLKGLVEVKSCKHRRARGVL